MTCGRFPDPFDPEDYALIEESLRDKAAHLRGLIQAREHHVTGSTRILWGHKAERCDELAGRIGRGEQTTVFRTGRGR